MFRKNSFIALFIAALLLAGGLACFAQAGKPLKGKVVVKKADGGTEPVADANLEFYRTDIKEGKLTSGKTDAKGAFVSTESVPSGQVFAILVTSPTINPQVATGVKGGDEVTITVEAGAGGVPSEEEVRELVLASSTSPDSEEGKRLRAEREKKVAEVNAKNEKAKNANQIVSKAQTEGNAAFSAKNYDLAIDKYTEGYNADPEFIGTAPTFLNNRATALKIRAIENYKKGQADPAVKATIAEPMKKDLLQSVDDYQKSLALLKTPVSDAGLQKQYDVSKKTAISGLVESYRLLIATRADTTHNKEAVAAAEQYAAVETDVVERTKAQLLLAAALRESGDSDNAIPVYRKVLEASPDNVDAIGGLGLSLFAVGVANENKEQKQEGLNLMEKFSQDAPDTNPMKGDIKGAVEYLKTNDKLTPQKVTTTKSTTKKKS